MILGEKYDNTYEEEDDNSSGDERNANIASPSMPSVPAGTIIIMYIF